MEAAFDRSTNLYRVTVNEIESQREEDPDSIPFSAGNPRVEHVVGALHLYRPRSHPDNDGAVIVQRSDGKNGTFTDQVCVLAVPGDMGFKDFCQFLGSYMPGICKMWMVRREDIPSKTMCMALLQFKEEDEASAFVLDYNGRPFSVLEPDVICRCVGVSRVEMARDPGAPRALRHQALPATSTALPPPSGHIELPTCPVCLERLDEHISGIITTVCNHKFHNECLQKWGDASCPVCRYCMHSNSASKCDVCDASVDLWICLICGHVGCGRYKDSHALQHFQDCQHCYSLELESGRVWDYVGDGYVHRLIQSNADGKLVEVPSPGPSHATSYSGQMVATAVGPSSAGKTSAARDRPYSAGPAVHDDSAALDEVRMMEAMYESKMDAVFREYNHLLSSQLESQRQYFEELRAQDTLDHTRNVQQKEQQYREQQALVTQSASRMQELEKSAQSMRSKLKESENKLKDARKEVETLTELNRGLIDNQKTYRDRLKSAEEAVSSRDATIKDLQEQVRDMMVFIEAGQMISANSNELAGGSAQVAPSPSTAKRGARKPKR